jgi:hypothetical protein
MQIPRLPSPDALATLGMTSFLLALMHPRGPVNISHGFVSSVPSGTRFFCVDAFPALKRRVIFCRPYGTCSSFCDSTHGLRPFDFAQGKLWLNSFAPSGLRRLCCRGCGWEKQVPRLPSLALRLRSE